MVTLYLWFQRRSFVLRTRHPLLKSHRPVWGEKRAENHFLSSMTQGAIYMLLRYTTNPDLSATLSYNFIAASFVS